MVNPGETNSIEQVRDLLLGTQLKDMEQRFVRQEERFLRELSDLREGMKTRFESLENFMKSEVSTLIHRLQEEKNERAAAMKDAQRENADALRNEKRERDEAFKNEKRERDDAMTRESREREEALTRLSKDLTACEEAFERRMTALSGTLDTVERDLRQLLMTENSRLSDKVDEKYKDAINALSVISTQIRTDMTTRSVLSGLLSEVAIKLAQWQGNDILVKFDDEGPLQIGQDSASGDASPAA
ncbi:MAG: hypothetical protein LBM17_09835 [Candidatus Accumulibacter sp.]|jgi:hypothetical protein|nr:hypothetical protein [Accumulibacter sp.]